MRLNSTMLRLKGISYSAKNRVILDNIHLELPGEGISALLGHNGSGKTMLLKIIAQLITPVSGYMEWGHKSPKNRANVSKKQSVAMVFQSPAILRCSVFSNVHFALSPLGLDGNAARERTEEVLNEVGLLYRQRDNARQLSGGEKQRLALARAWAIKPDLLLLDEPTANLDPTATASVEKIIRKIRTEGTKVVMATHNLAQATRLADDVIFLDNGRVEEHTATQLFFAKPQSAPAAAFIKGELPWRISFAH